jgi:hypothetical protein
MNPLIQLKSAAPLFVVALVCFGLLPRMQAVSPTPDGCYPNFTTAEGCDALSLLTTGAANTGLGWRSLFSNSDGSFNTGVGGGALTLNNADSNTAVGAVALLLNTDGEENTAVGTGALLYNDGGNGNNAVGAFALHDNIDGNNNNAFGPGALFKNIHASFNTAVGAQALFFNDISGNNVARFNTAVGASALNSNTDGSSNTAVGYQALFSNDVGFGNAAVGDSSLTSNSSGANNTAMGSRALTANDTGNFNTAVGLRALEDNVSGGDNTAIGSDAGRDVDGSGNICIGSGAFGFPGQDGIIQIGGQFSGHDACYIDGIYGRAWGTADMAVRIGNDGKLGTVVSSRRFKHDIKQMDKASEAILALKPVTFHYSRDANNTPAFGLIAEDVAEVNPDLVIRDKEGKPYSVRYEDVNVMLLNEFLKEHRRNEDQEATIARLIATDTRQQTQIEALTAALQKVSAQLEASKPAPQVVNNP